MRKVKNTKVISRLSTRILQAKRKKNFIAVMAIVLTSILFTTVFAVGGNMLYTIQENTFIQVGSRSHAGFKNFTQEEYDILAKDEKIQDLSYNIFVGFTTNSKLKKIQGEVRYFEERNAKNCFAYPTTGHLPQKEDEVAMSTTVLDALEIPHELGQKVPLEITIHEKTVKKTFTLCGYWEGNAARPAEEIAVSRQFCDVVAPVETGYYYDSDTPRDYSGYINADFDFPTSWDIEGQMDTLCQRCGFDQSKVNTGVNWAYTTASVDGETLLLVAAMLFLILLSGYLIIYNVFYLNIYSDIRSYGLLKTIGTTGKQLKKLVNHQATRLCIVGIPVGLLLGWGVGRFLTPVIMSILSMGDAHYSANPLIFLGAALFSWITVRISCIKPCKIAAKVSPIEAVRYTEGQCHRSGKRRKARKNSLFAMARANMSRNVRKAILVIASCALSMIILNGVYTIVTGFDMDKYLANYMMTDFSVTDATIVAYTGRDYVYDGVTAAFQEELRNQKGITEIGNIYEVPVYYDLSEEELQNLDKISRKDEFAEYFNEPPMSDVIEDIKQQRTMVMNIYGVDETASGMITLFEGELDWDKFNSGNYVIINGFTLNDQPKKVPESIKNIGDKITLNFDDGHSKEYEVMAIGEVPYSIGSRVQSDLGIECILPRNELYAVAGERQPLRTVFNAESGSVSRIEKWLEDYTENINTDLAYESRAVYVKEFENTQRVYIITGGFLSFILGLIGILNFVNVMVTSIYSRRQELAMMESIGMTGAQQKRMLQYEGLLYGLYAIVISCTLGIAVGYGIVQLIAGQMWMFTWHFTLLPIAICAPILLILSYIIPLICYCRICASTSVVERLRVVE